MAKNWTAAHRRELARITAKTIKVPPFPNDTPQARAKRLARVNGEGWRAFGFFCKAYFPHIFELPFCDAHRVMFEEVEEHTGVTAVTGFRGLGKTVLMAIVYPIWRVIKGERYVIHTAADLDLAEERTKFTRNELENNARLMNDFPRLMIDEGDESDFYLKNNTRIRARGIRQAHRGTTNPRTAKRPGLIVCDDIDSEANQGNMSIGRKKLDKITQEVAGALNPKTSGRVIWLGNLVHPNYAICQFLTAIEDDLKANTPNLATDVMSILRAEQRAILRFPVEDTEGASVWPEQFATERLPSLRALYGPTGYQREFLGKPVIEGTMFKHEWFTYWGELPKKFRQVWLYSDPAWGEKGCHKAIIAAGWDGLSFYVVKVWVRQIHNDHFFRALYDAFSELNLRYGVRFKAAIETVFGQHRILADFDRWAISHHLPPISHMIKHINTQENKDLRIERLESSIFSGNVLFPAGQDTHVLISQFLTYPQGAKDGPDALAGCLERFRAYDPRKNRVTVRRFGY